MEDTLFFHPKIELQLTGSISLYPPTIDLPATLKLVVTVAPTSGSELMPAHYIDETGLLVSGKSAAIDPITGASKSPPQCMIGSWCTIQHMVIVMPPW